MKPLRVLHVISSVNPSGGGPIEGVKQLYRPLRLNGIEVEILSSDSPDDEWVTSLDIPVHALGPSLGNYAFAPKLLGWLKANHKSYSVVIVEGIWQYHSLAVFLGLWGTQTPYFVFTHGMLDPWFKKQYPIKHLKKWIYWPWAEYWVLRLAKGVLFTCDEERLLARESFWLYKCREFVVSYGIKSPPLRNSIDFEKILHNYPELVAKRIVLFVGRMHEKKGCDILIKSFAEVARENDDLHLLMVGPDQSGLQFDLQKLAQDLGISNRITWTGLLTGNDKWAAYYLAEIFALPSHQENFGVVVAEALACGKPVLISNKVNIWREVYRDHAGFVGDDDVESTVRSLRSWSTMTHDEILALGERAKFCFASQFNVETTSRKLISVIRDCVGS